MKFRIRDVGDSWVVEIQKFGSWVRLTGLEGAVFITPEQARAAILDNVKSAEEVSE